MQTANGPVANRPIPKAKMPTPLTATITSSSTATSNQWGVTMARAPARASKKDTLWSTNRKAENQ